MSQHNSKPDPRQVGELQSEVLSQLCGLFLRPLFVDLHRLLDRRLVLTLYQLVLALLLHRHRPQSLLLSELGAGLASPALAPAGTKRLSRLLHSSRWTAEVILGFLWELAEQKCSALWRRHETPLVIWDESVLEKAESLHLEGLSPVRSTKAARLKRIKPGYFNPPGGRPIFVPGFHWLALLVAGRQGPPVLAHLRWWTIRGPLAGSRSTERWQLLAELSQRWGPSVIHVWDQGYAGQPWLTLALGYHLRFVLRWRKAFPLYDALGQLRPAWQSTRGKRSWGHRRIWDARRHCEREVGVVAVPVYDSALRFPLWLVVARPGRGQKPWYLITSEPIQCEEDAWRTVFIYARRWQVEMAIRFQKCELGAESPRVWSWEVRSKLLGVVALAYAFLLSLLDPLLEELRTRLLYRWCHRTGKRSREVSTPLYRLRLALSALWRTYPPPPFPRLDSG